MSVFERFPCIRRNGRQSFRRETGNTMKILREFRTILIQKNWQLVKIYGVLINRHSWKAFLPLFFTYSFLLSIHHFSTFSLAYSFFSFSILLLFNSFNFALLLYFLLRPSSFFIFFFFPSHPCSHPLFPFPPHFLSLLSPFIPPKNVLPTLTIQTSIPSRLTLEWRSDSLF